MELYNLRRCGHWYNGVYWCFAAQSSIHQFTHRTDTHSHTHHQEQFDNLEFSTLPKNTLTCWLQGPAIKLLTFWLVWPQSVSIKLWKKGPTLKSVISFAGIAGVEKSFNISFQVWLALVWPSVLTILSTGSSATSHAALILLRALFHLLS